MKKTSKSVLASAFVFPGIGHIILKRYATSTALIATAIAATAVLITSAINIAMGISEKLVTGEIPPNINVIRTMIADQQANAQTPWISVATWVLLATWLIGILDSYRVGKALEKRKST